MDKTRTIGQKYLANELILSFLALKKCAKAQCNPIILSKLSCLQTTTTTKTQPTTKTDRNQRKNCFFFILRGPQNIDI